MGGIDDKLLEDLRAALKKCSASEKVQNTELYQLYQYADKGSIQLQVSSLGGTSCVVEANSRITVRELKVKVEGSTAVPCCSQQLVTDQVLQDSERLASYHITPLSPQVTLVRKAPSHIYVLGGYAEDVGIFGGHGLQAGGEMLDVARRAWVCLPTMATARARFTSVDSEGASITVMGGYGNSGGTLSSVEKLDLGQKSQRCWTEAHQMEIPRVAFASAQRDGLLYIIGGAGPWGTTAAVQALDLATGATRERSSMLEARSRFGLALLDGRIYVVGGWNNERGLMAMASAEVFDPITNLWAPLQPMSTPRRALAVVSASGLIYAIGGFDGCHALKSVETFNPVTGSWSQMPAMATPRAGVAAVALDDKIYVMGGNDHGPPLASAEVFDPAWGVWEPLPPMQTPRACHVAGLASF